MKYQRHWNNQLNLKLTFPCTPHLIYLRYSNEHLDLQLLQLVRSKFLFGAIPTCNKTGFNMLNSFVKVLNLSDIATGITFNFIRITIGIFYDFLFSGFRDCCDILRFLYLELLTKKVFKIHLLTPVDVFP